MTRLISLRLGLESFFKKKKKSISLNSFSSVFVFWCSCLTFFWSSRFFCVLLYVLWRFAVLQWVVWCCVGAEKRWKRQTKEVFSPSELQLLYTQILGGAVRVWDLILHAHYMLFNCGFLLRNVQTKLRVY